MKSLLEWVTETIEANGDNTMVLVIPVNCESGNNRDMIADVKDVVSRYWDFHEKQNINSGILFCEPEPED